MFATFRRNGVASSTPPSTHHRNKQTRLWTHLTYPGLHACLPACPISEHRHSISASQPTSQHVQKQQSQKRKHTCFYHASLQSNPYRRRPSLNEAFFFYQPLLYCTLLSRMEHIRINTRRLIRAGLASSNHSCANLASSTAAQSISFPLLSRVSLMHSRESIFLLQPLLR